MPHISIPGHHPGIPVTVVQDRQGLALNIAQALEQAGMPARLITSIDQISPNTRALIIPGGLSIQDDMYQTSEFVQNAHHLLQRLDETMCNTPGFVLFAIDLGGGLGLRPFTPAQAPLGGLMGLAQHYTNRWHGGCAKVIDIDLNAFSGDALAQQLTDEILKGGSTPCIAFDAHQTRLAQTPHILDNIQSTHNPCVNKHLVVLGELTPTNQHITQAIQRDLNCTISLISQSPPVIEHNIDTTITASASDMNAIFDAFDLVRKTHQKVDGLIFLPHDDTQDDPRVGLLSMALVATLSDDLNHIALIHHANHTNANHAMIHSALTLFAHNEQRKRHDACAVKSITCHMPITVDASTSIMKEIQQPAGTIEVHLSGT